MSPVKVLVVDDGEPFRQLIRRTLQPGVKFQVIGEASDGLDDVQKAKELHPDLILLDIGLPKLSGIEAARQMRELAPHSRILFLSQESSSDVVQEGLRLGARGYVLKTHVRTELPAGIEAVLAGRQFVGSGLDGGEYAERTASWSTCTN